MNIIKTMLLWVVQHRIPTEFSVSTIYYVSTKYLIFGAKKENKSLLGELKKGPGQIRTSDLLFTRQAL